MLPLLLLLFFAHKTIGQEVNATIAVSNATLDDLNKTITMERITQPTRSQTQQIERAVEARNITDFKPSPALESYFEYNNFPVKPAFPEAKTLRDSPWISPGKNRWDQKGYEQQGDAAWSTKLKFPEDNNKPYPFVTNTEEGNRYLQPQPSYLTNKEGFAFNKPVESPKHTRPIYTIGHEPSPVEKTGPWEYQRPPVIHKTVEYNILEKPAPAIQKTQDYGMSEYEEINPWKKILKLLLTFIPIGLLISALTPSVISVSSMNDTNTQNRWRSDEPKKELADHLVSSLNYFDKLNENGCEFRVFCELLVTASNMQNSEDHVKNLLDNFAKQETDLKTKAEDIKKVFEAVKNQDCRPIKCKNIKKPR